HCLRPSLLRHTRSLPCAAAVDADHRLHPLPSRNAALTRSPPSRDSVGIARTRRADPRELPPGDTELAKPTGNGGESDAKLLTDFDDGFVLVDVKAPQKLLDGFPSLHLNEQHVRRLLD